MGEKHTRLAAGGRVLVARPGVDHAHQEEGPRGVRRGARQAGVELLSSTRESAVIIGRPSNKCLLPVAWPKSSQSPPTTRATISIEGVCRFEAEWFADRGAGRRVRQSLVMEITPAKNGPSIDP